jgi:sugar transferase (PEP-CTERM/EpsH1 system associated)
MGAPAAPVHDARPLVLHVVYRFAVGGLENGIVNLINRLPAERFRHGIVALTDASAEFCARIRRDDVMVESLRKPPGHLVRLYPRLHRLFRAHRPAIVHTRNLAALEAVVPAWSAGVGVRIHGEHGRDVADLDGSNRKYQLVRRAYAPFVTRWVALSHDLDRYLVRRVGVPETRVDQICNGVDTDRFRPAPGGREAIPGCPFTSPDLWLAGTVGRMQAVKDQTSLARAFVGALRRHPDARRRMRLVMVGDGPLRAAAERILADAGVADLAWFAGERDDVPGILRGLDCFVLPSLAEGISNTILEAMATRLPVVATRVGGNAELLEDGLDGRLVPAAHPDALAEAIVGYFGDAPLARRHARAARAAVERQFSLDRMVADYLALYENALAQRRPNGVLRPAR